MQWQDSEDIGIELYEQHPDTDPLTVRFTELLKLVLALEDFEGEASECNEAKLEAIQMAWHEEYQEMKDA